MKLEISTHNKYDYIKTLKVAFKELDVADSLYLYGKYSHDITIVIKRL